MTKEYIEELNYVRRTRYSKMSDAEWVSFLRRIRSLMKREIKNSDLLHSLFCGGGMCKALQNIIVDVCCVRGISCHADSMGYQILSLVKPTNEEIMEYNHSPVYWGRPVGSSFHDDNVSRVMLWQVAIENLSDVINYYKKEGGLK
jgi:hypothetical protein